MKDGIPDMRIPPLEPLLIPSAVQDSGSAFRAYFKNISLYGLTSFKLTNFDFDVDTNTANLGLVFDALRGLGDYRIQGMLLVLQLDGGGKIDVTLSKRRTDYVLVFNKLFVDNVVIGAKLRGHRKEVKGKEYLVFDQNDFNVSVGGGKVYFADLFKGNPELTENTNKVINENVSVIIDELTPVIKSVLEQVILGTVLQLFERFSINELFTVND